MSPNACGCPTINPADWEGKLFNWEGKAFFYKHVKYLFSVPLNVERKMAEAAQMIEQRGYILEEPLMILAREGRFKGTIFVAILPTEGEDKSVINVPPCALAATVYQRKEAKIGRILYLQEMIHMHGRWWTTEHENRPWYCAGFREYVRSVLRPCEE